MSFESSELYTDKTGVIKGLTGLYESFSDLLLYEKIKGDIFQLKDGSLGSVLTYSGICDDSLSLLELKKLRSDFELFSLFPEGTCIQVIKRYQFEDAKNSHEEVKDYTSLIKRIQTEKTPDKTANEKVYIFIRLPLNRSRLTDDLLSYFRSSKKEAQLYQKRIEKFQKGLSFLTSNIPGFSKSEDKTLREYLGLVLNDRDYSSFYNTGDKLTFSKYEAVPDKFYVGDKEYKAFSLDIEAMKGQVDPSVEAEGCKIPEFSFVNLCKSINPNVARGASEVYLITNMRVMNKNTDFAFQTTIKNFYLGGEKETEEMSNFQSLDKTEHGHLMANIKNSEEVFLNCSTHILVGTGKGKGFQADTFQNEIRKRTGLKFIEERLSGSAIFYSSLPFHYFLESEQFIQRWNIINKEQMTYFLPLYVAEQGSYAGQEIFRNRIGNSIKIETPNRGEGQHTIFVGMTGKGKSTIQIAYEMALQNLENAPYIFKLDSNTTSLNYAHIYDAQMNIFQNEEFPMSPFVGVYNTIKVEFITNFILSIITLNNPTFTVDVEHRDLVAQGVILAHRNKTDKETFLFKEGRIKESKTPSGEIISLTLDEILSAVSEIVAKPENNSYEKYSEEILRKLSSFYGKGLRAGYFDHHETKKRNSNKIRVYDFGDLGTDKIYNSLVSVAVVHEVEQTINRLYKSEKDAWGFLVIEELGAFANNPFITKMVIDAAERMRKKGFSLIVITPNFNHLFSKLGTALMATTSKYIFTELGNEDVEAFLNKFQSSQHLKEDQKNAIQRAVFSDANISLLQSLKTKKGQYAEFLQINKSNGIGRVYRNYYSKTEEIVASSANTTMKKKLSGVLKKYRGNFYRSANEILKEKESEIS